MGALVCAIYLGLVQTLIAGGIFYLAAPAVVARGRAGEPTAPPPAPGRVVLARLNGVCQCSWMYNPSWLGAKTEFPVRI